MASPSLSAAVLGLSSDTGRTMSVLSHLGASERRVFLDTLRPQNPARWAAVAHRMASESRYLGELTDSEVRDARDLCRQLVMEAVAA